MKNFAKIKEIKEIQEGKTIQQATANEIYQMIKDTIEDEQLWIIYFISV